MGAAEPLSRSSSMSSSGFKSLTSLFLAEPLPKSSTSDTWLANLPRVSSSATKEVVMLTRGNIVTFETWLNIAMATPTAAISTGPINYFFEKWKKNSNEFKNVA